VAAILAVSKDHRGAAVALLSAKVAAVAWPSVRDLYASRAVVKVAVAKESKQEGTQEAKPEGGGLGALASYAGFEASVARLRSHQTLALARGKDRGTLAVTVALLDPAGASHAADREVRSQSYGVRVCPLLWAFV